MADGFAQEVDADRSLRGVARVLMNEFAALSVVGEGFALWITPWRHSERHTERFTK